MYRRTVAVLGLVAMATIATTLQAQQPTDLMRKSYRTGPRFGVTWLGGAIVDTIKAKYKTNVGAVISQFGWQYEKQFASLEGGPVALNEFILMVGGLDQNTAIPSLTWLVGVRTEGQFEFGVGPNFTPMGVSLAVSMGQTFRAGGLSIPVNIAIVPGRYGARSSLLTGFNLYR
jgi:hypothetical protein